MLENEHGDYQPELEHVDGSSSVASPDLEEARRALRFAATQRIKQWKGDNAAGSSAGQHSRSAPKPLTKSERERVRNDQLEATRRERRMRTRELQAKLAAGGSDDAAQKSSARSNTPGSSALSARIERLTQPTQATIFRKRAVYETSTPSVAPSSNSVTARPATSSIRSTSTSVSRRSLVNVPPVHRGSQPSSLNTSLEQPISAVRKSRGALCLVAADDDGNQGNDATIDEELVLLEARMRFLEERKQTNEAHRQQTEKARLEALGKAVAPTANPQPVYEGGVVKDPTSGRRYQRLFSFRLHDIVPQLNSNAAHVKALGPPPLGAGRAGSMHSTYGGGCTGVDGLLRSTSNVTGPVFPTDAADAQRDSATRTSGASPVNNNTSFPGCAVDHGGPDNASETQDTVGSPTSRWMIDSAAARRRSRQHGADDADEPLLLATQQTGSDDDDHHGGCSSPESPANVVPQAPSRMDGAALSAMWSSDGRCDTSPVLNSPSEGLVRFGSRDNIPALPSASASMASPEFYQSVIPPSPVAKPAGTPGGSSNASPPASRSARRSLVGFADNVPGGGGLVQSPHHLRGGESDSPTSPRHLLPPPLMGDDDMMQPGRSPEGPRTVIPSHHQQRGGSMEFLEPERSFYARGRGSIGVLGCSDSEARLLAAAASQDSELSQQDLDLVAQMVIPSEVEASFQLMDNAQKRQLVRRYSTMRIKRMQSSVDRR